MKNLFCLAISSLLISCCGTDNTEVKIVEYMGLEDQKVNYYMSNLSDPFKVMFLADLHFTVEDERGREFYDFSKRMGGNAVEPENYGVSNGREKKLIISLEKAKKEGVKLVILGGDIINFPSEASVDSLLQIMDDSGLDWTFIAGNHDWHYEGESGKPSELRAKWAQKSLKPLYQGENPMYVSKIINDINFVIIDNSTNEVSEEQVAFFKEQLAKDMPVVLAVHIPIYLPQYKSNVDYGCGHPLWGEASDMYYKIERRVRWPKEGHKQSTYDFRDLILNSDNVIGVYAGHTHKKIIDMHDNIFQYVVDANFSGDDVILNFMKAEK